MAKSDKKKKTRMIVAQSGIVATAGATPPMRRAPLHRERGTALLSTGNSGTTGYCKLHGSLVSCNSLGERLARLASLYETYEVNSLYFEVVLQGSLTASCGFIMAFDSDPGDDDPQQTLVGVQDMSQWEHNLSFSHLDGQQHRMHVRLRRPMLRGWYTSYNMAGDYRFSYCGQIYLYTTAAPTVAITWTLYAGYDISFFEPQIERIIPGAGGADVIKRLRRPGQPTPISCIPWTPLVPLSPLCVELAMAPTQLLVLSGVCDLTDLAHGCWSLLRLSKPPHPLLPMVLM
jgi:hypothetical protein